MVRRGVRLARSKGGRAYSTREETRSSLGVAEDSFVVTYAGTMGRLQGLGHIMDAAIDLRDVKEVVM